MTRPTAGTRSKAAVCLDTALAPEPKRLTRSGLASLLGVSKQAVSGWCSGRTRPSPEMALAIERRLKIPMQAWLSPDPESPSDDAASDTTADTTAQSPRPQPRLSAGKRKH
jgi:transcriptional regulator with XRE-family HTH domain